MAHASVGFEVNSPAQLAALASSSRQEIIDVLAQMGTVSVCELGNALGRPPDAIYYHLRVLKSCGLVLTAGYRTIGRRKEELIRCVSPNVQLQYELGPNGNASRIRDIVSSMLRLGIRDFAAALGETDTCTSGPGREIWAMRKTGWLNPDELVKLNEAIQDIGTAASKPHGKGRLFGVTVILTPLNHRARSGYRKTGSKRGKSV